MSCFEDNMECLKNIRPNFYKLILDFKNKDTFRDVDEVFSEETFNKENTLFIKKDGQLFRLNSKYNPSFEANQWVKQYEIHEFNNAVLMYGLGSGSFLRSMLKNLHKNDVALVYEPSIEIFFHVLERYDLTDIFSDTRLLIFIEHMNHFEFHFALREVMNVTNIHSQIICNHPYYNEIFSQGCVEFWKEIKDSYTSTIVNVNTEVVFGDKFIENIMKNIMFLKGSISIPELKTNIPEEIPAIIVAAGPSVEQNIEELKRAKGKAVIFAVDRILDYLLDSGLEPDFVVTLDPAKPIQYFSRREDVKIPLITFMQASHDVLLRHKGTKIICNCSSFLKEVYIENKKETPMTYSSTSVATVAFTVCMELNFKTIILVGQDLAYNGKASHAGNVSENIGEDKDVMVEGINGELIKSRYDWKNFLIWYQDMIQLHSELNVIDAKQTGARIKGTTVMPLEEAVKIYGKIDFDSKKIMERIPITFNPEEMIKVKEYLEDSVSNLNKIGIKSKEAIKHCDFLIKEYNKNNASNKKINDAIKKIGRVNDYIRKQPLYDMIDFYIMSSSVQNIAELYRFTGNIHEDNIKTYERAKHVFESIIQGLDFIKQRLEEAISNVL